MTPISLWNIVLGLLVLGTVGYVGVQAFTTSGLLQANTIHVTSTADVIAEDGSCTLREAIIAANTDSINETNQYGAIPGECPAGSGDDIIVVPAGTYKLEIPGTGEDAAFTGDLDITDNLTITGTGQATTIVDASGIDRVFHILSDTTVEISGVTVRNGDTSESGGGISNDGMLTLTNSTVRDNTGNGGGGISNSGTLTLTNTTISGNTSVGGSGGILNWARAGGGEITLSVTNTTISGNAAGAGAGGIGSSAINSTITLSNSTISGNSADDGGGILLVGKLALTNVTVADNTARRSGGGIAITDGSGTLTNTIIANNPTGDCEISSSDTIVSHGNNLDSDGTCNLTEPTDFPNTDPLLGPLQNNGGPTETHALLPGSPAIDHILSEDCAVTTDQRGVPRPLGSGCDIGAYETEGEETEGDVNHSPVADAGTDQTIECSGADGALVSLDGAGSRDSDGDPLIFLWTAPGIVFDGPASPTPLAVFPLGTTTVSLTVTDPEGLSDTDTIDVTVLGANAVGLTVEADPPTLWPPNHQYVRIHLSVRVSDTCGPLSAITAVARSSEPDNGTGDGNTTGDIRVTTAGGDVRVSSNASPEVAFDPINDRLELRAERVGGGNGRTYTITVLATDTSSNQASAIARVVVPHDQGN